MGPFVRALAILAVAASFCAAAPPPHPAVVRVAAPERDGVSYGSGTLVAVNESSGLVLTNWHVVRDAIGPILVYFPDGFRSGAYLLGTDRDWDLAALAIRRPNVAPVPLAAEAPQPGELVSIAGYGSGSYRILSGQVTQYVSPGNNQPFEMIELGAPARNGDSGGPIFNSRGELAGTLFGSAFGRTTGSYCGRLRWFLNSVDGDFRRISAQALLAQQARGERPPVVAINAAPVRQESSPANLPVSLHEQQQVVRPIGDERLAMVPVQPQNQNLAASAPVAAISAPPASTSLPSPNKDQVMTILAAIGALAICYHAMRLLGRAIG
ncbi:MAG: serine protease [Planctomycetaceae bacterium]|nr:serine protease [Planctomycetaceae bacterium]